MKNWPNSFQPLSNFIKSGLSNILVDKINSMVALRVAVF